MTPDEFLKWEAHSKDTIDVKRIYIDITGDVISGVLLSQLMYWHLPSKEGNTRMKVEEAGELWVRKTREDWWDECRITPKQFDRSSKVLEDKGFAEIKKFNHQGRNTNHIRLLIPNIITGIKTFENKKQAGGSDSSPKGKCRFPKGKVSLPERGSDDSPNGKYESDEESSQSMDSKDENSQTTAETTSEITTDTVKEKIVKENLVRKESVTDKEGMKDSVLTTPNSYTVSVDEIFLKESIEKNKEKDFRCRALYETLLNRAESAEFAPIDNIGDVAKFKDKSFRYRRKYNTGEISCALELYAALPINSLHRRDITDYIKHEYQKWDFSQTRNENTVKGQFILEYILWHPVYAHFKVINENGLLQADIENYSKRNTPQNKKEQPDDYWDVAPNHF